MIGSQRLLPRIEAMAIRLTERHWSLIPAKLAARSRAQAVHIGDALATLMPGSDSLRMNRVLGLGHRRRADAGTIEALIERYRAARIPRFSILSCPGPHAKGIQRRLAARGFVRRPGHALLLRDCRKPVVPADTTLRVVRERGVWHQAAIEILGESFPMPPSRRAWTLASRSRDGVEHYLAFAGLRPAAVASLMIDGDLAWLGGAATRTRWRRRGGQGALIATRLARAARRGCRWAWSETAEPMPGRPDASRRNLLRNGFVQMCLKRNYLWVDR